jgi:hypothetical protein
LREQLLGFRADDNKTTTLLFAVEDYDRRAHWHDTITEEDG